MNRHEMLCSLFNHPKSFTLNDLGVPFCSKIWFYCRFD